MSVINRNELAEHIGHKIEVVKYSSEEEVYSVCVECETCYEVLFEMTPKK